MSNFTIIRSTADLRAGDHISWPTHMASGMLRHHAIVVNVLRIHGSRVEVIHVVAVGGMDLPASARSISCSAYGSGSPGIYWVVEDTLDLDEQVRNGNLHRYSYASEDCNPPATVIENARSKFGRFDYNTLYNNCEHFARWCKTGNRTSHQAFFFAIYMLILAVVVGVLIYIAQTSE